MEASGAHAHIEHRSDEYSDMRLRLRVGSTSRLCQLKV
jgi:hypothetical protein